MAVLGAAAGGGGGGGQLPTISFMTSQTWTPSYDLTAYVYVIGGGGAGGTKQSGYGGACGGGAGGCAVSKLDLKSGTTYTITIGAGGASQTAAGSNANGNNGNNTTFVDGSSVISTMTGGLGYGGVTRASNDSTQVAGAAGGTASGGTLGNFTGGKGAAITASVNNIAYVMGGGGAVGLWANGNDAPDALSNYGYTVPGGMLNVEGGDLPANKYYNRMNEGGADDHELSGYPTIEAFTGILTTEVSYADYISTAGSYADYDHTFEKRTGAMDAKGRGFTHSSKVWMGMSPPFQGASGWGGAYGYGQRGCAGSGGGGCFSYAQTDGYGGAGGNGLVLVFPVSLGA